MAADARDLAGFDARDRRGVRAIAAGLALVAALLVVHPIRETDSLWHVWLGGLVVATRSRTVPEVVAFPDFTDPHVAQEWLFSVLAWLAHRLASVGGLTALLVALSAASAVAVVGLAVRGGARRPASVALVAGLGVALVLFRMSVRPEALALVVLPTFLGVARAFVEADAARARRARGAALVALEVVWAQAHGSFVLGPVLFALVAAPSALAPRAPAHRRDALVVLAALGIALFSGPEGLRLFTYLATHGGGDATRHIFEWNAARWADLDPTGRGQGATYLALWLVALAGMLASRRVFPSELALGLLGLVLVGRAARFFTPAGVLLVPLAAAGADRLLGEGRARWLGLVAGVAGLSLGVRTTQADTGPIFSTGIPDDVNPRLAARLLARAPEGTRVLTSYDAGAAIGLWLGGRVRTWVDSRTPSYFDDTDFAASREAFATVPGIGRALARYDAAYAVLARNPTCPAGGGPVAPPSMALAVVEPAFSTFARRGLAPEITRISPCGQDFLTRDACDDGARVLDADIARLEELGPSPFVGQLRAERVARCGGDAAAAIRLVPSEGEAMSYRPLRDRVLGRLLLATGDAVSALELLCPLVARGDRRATATVVRAVATLPRDRARACLEGAARSFDDATPAALRVAIGRLCVADGDVECVRYQATRAAVSGDQDAAPLLAWVEAHHASERVRRDVAAWRRVLAADTGSSAPPAAAAQDDGASN
jgi:hypothetical protein